MMRCKMIYNNAATTCYTFYLCVEQRSEPSSTSGASATTAPISARHFLFFHFPFALFALTAYTLEAQSISSLALVITDVCHVSFEEPGRRDVV